jgi:hypothetical protein
MLFTQYSFYDSNELAGFFLTLNFQLGGEGEERPKTDASNSSQKRSFKPKKTFDFDNGDTALSEVSYACADRPFSTCFKPFASFQIDRLGNMDGHCDYKFYTGATFSGRMRHGERFVLSAPH